MSKGVDKKVWSFIIAHSGIISILYNNYCEH